MSALLQNGLCVVAGLDVSRRIDDKAIFILRSCAPATMKHVALAPLCNDRLATIDMSEVQVGVMRQMIRQYYNSGQLKFVKMHLFFRFTIRETPNRMVDKIQIARYTVGVYIRK